MVTLAAAIFVGVVAISVLISVLGLIANGIESACDETRSAKITRDHAQRERDLYSMPMAQLDAEIARLEEKDRAASEAMCTGPIDVVGLRQRANQGDPAAGPRIIRWQRKQFDNHPGAKLLPDGVKKLAELAKWRSARAYRTED